MADTLPVAASDPPAGSGTRPAAWITHRVLAPVGVLWAATSITFLRLRRAPGGIAYAISGTTQISPAVRAQITHEYGLDRPLLLQYLTYLGRVVRGDLGQSFGCGSP